MDKALIEKLAEQAGIACPYKGELRPAIREGYDTRDELEVFAALIAEECAKIVIEASAPDDWHEPGRAVADQIRVAFRK